MKASIKRRHIMAAYSNERWPKLPVAVDFNHFFPERTKIPKHIILGSGNKKIPAG
ncbi:MAG: hypothetical protein HYV35_08650 [Lentisphaerae bacterium]|nr:hypothetical protein [Lentisphaerota bacterium]